MMTAAAAPAPVAPLRLAPGRAVEHPAFGAGVVVSINERYTVIRFGGTQRQFVTSIVAPMLTPPRSLPSPRRPEPAEPPHRRRLPAAAAPPAQPAPAVRPPRKQPQPSRPAVTCQQCGKSWHPLTAHPKACAHCNSHYWNKPKGDYRKVAGQKRRKHQSSRAIDRIIREAYDRLRKHRDRTALAAAAEAIGWPKWAISARALELGLSRVKEVPWSEEEIQLLREFDELSVSAVQRKLAAAGFERTPTAVNLKIRRLRLRAERDWYSPIKLARAFGEDAHKVMGWIRRGWLKAELRGTDRTKQQGGDSWIVRPADVREFVFAHAEEIDLAHVDKWWFLELVTDGRIKR